MAPRTAGSIVALILGAVSGVELGRVAANAPWGAFTPLASHTVAIILSAIWLVAAFALVLRVAYPRLELLAWLTALPAVFLLFAHGLIATWGGAGISADTRIALVYSVLGIGLVVLLRRAFLLGVSAPVPQPIPWRSATPAPARERRAAYAR